MMRGECVKKKRLLVVKGREEHVIYLWRLAGYRKNYIICCFSEETMSHVSSSRCQAMCMAEITVNGPQDYMVCYELARQNLGCDR